MKRPLLIAAIALAVPTVALAAGGAAGHAGPDVGGLVRHGINLVILLAILYTALKGPMSDFLNFRRSEVKEQLDKSLVAKTNAETRYAELQSRLDNFGAELDQLRAQVKVDADAERESLVASATRSAAQIEQAAQRTISEELRRARATLRAEAVDLSVSIAEELLTRSINDDDQARLAGDYLTRVEETARR